MLKRYYRQFSLMENYILITKMINTLLYLVVLIILVKLVQNNYKVMNKVFPSLGQLSPRNRCLPGQLLFWQLSPGQLSFISLSVSLCYCLQGRPFYPLFILCLLYFVLHLHFSPFSGSTSPFVLFHFLYFLLSLSSWSLYW